MKIDLEEPNYPGNDSDEVKAIVPNQTVAKDPQIENTGNNEAIVYLKVEVPQEEYTELGTDNVPGEKKLQDLFVLKDVSDQWELIRTETTTTDDGKTKTSYIYAYKKPLGKGETTDKLFQKVQMKNSMESDLASKVEDIIVTAYAIQSTDVSDISLTPAEDGTLGKDVLDQVYEIFLNQSGQETPRPADEGNRSQTGKLGKITYDLDGGSLEGALTEYGTGDYGYTPPTPTKEGYIFAGWTPENIPADSEGSVSFTANWKASGNISYDLDGGTLTGEKTQYTVDDYGYTPPDPVKEGYVFDGWSPENIPDGTSGDVKFTASWHEMAETATTISGYKLNRLMISLAGNKYNITAFQKSDVAPSKDIRQNADNLISDSTSDGKIYAWYEDGIIKYYAEAKKVYCNKDFSDTFNGFTDLTDASGLADLDATNVTDIGHLFKDCKNLLSIDPLQNWKPAKLTNMEYAFDTCEKITNVNALKDWDTTLVENLRYTFAYCRALSDISGLVSWNTINVSTMECAFLQCNSLQSVSALTSWNTVIVANMAMMFNGCNIQDAEALNDWDIKNVHPTTQRLSEADADVWSSNGFYAMFGQNPTHPNFTKRQGTWTASKSYWAFP